MTDYLGPIALGSSGTYTLASWQRSSDSLSAAVEVMVTGASADACAAAVEALVAQLRIGNTYVHAITGATYPAVYLVTSVSEIVVDEYAGILKFWAPVTFTLGLADYPVGALTTLYNAEAVSAPSSLTLAALLGTHAPDLDLTIDDSSTNDMHSVWACLAPRALTADQTIAMGTRAHWLVYAASLTWTTMSNRGATATAWSNDPRYTTSASWQTAALDTSKYPKGTYKLLARVKQEAGTGYVMDSRQQVPVAVTRTTFHLIEMGDIDLPVADTAFGTASNLTLYARSDGTNDLDVDAYLLLPLDHGLVSWHPDIPTSEIDQLDVGPSGVFMDGACDMTYLRGGVLQPRILAAHTGTLVSPEEPTGNDWPSGWTRDSGAAVTADTGRFKIVSAGADHYASYAGASNLGSIVTSGEWYEFAWTREVSARVAGSAYVGVNWVDIDGNVIRWDTLDTRASVDAAPVDGTAYLKAPVHAARALVSVGSTGTATLTAYYANVALRRCPLQLLVVAEDAAGALSSNRHAVAVTLKYRARYEVAR